MVQNLNEFGKGKIDKEILSVENLTKLFCIIVFDAGMTTNQLLLYYFPEQAICSSLIALVARD